MCGLYHLRDSHEKRCQEGRVYGQHGKHVWTSSSLALETWVMVNKDISVAGERVITKESSSNQSKTQEEEGGGKKAKAKADANDDEAKQSTMVTNRTSRGSRNQTNRGHIEFHQYTYAWRF